MCFVERPGFSAVCFGDEIPNSRLPTTAVSGSFFLRPNRDDEKKIDFVSVAVGAGPSLLPKVPVLRDFYPSGKKTGLEHGLLHASGGISLAQREGSRVGPVGLFGLEMWNRERWRRGCCVANNSAGLIIKAMDFASAWIGRVRI